MAPAPVIPAPLGARALASEPRGRIGGTLEAASQPIELVGAWDRQGLLWVLASSPDEGYYQLGYWTGAGPLRTFRPARGGPVALTAPGPS